MKIESATNTFASQSLNSNMNVNNVEVINSVNTILDGPKTEQGRREENNIKLSEKSIKEVIENTNKKLVATDRKFEFSINEETNDIIVKVINKETDEIIREIPSEKILDMVAKMMDLAGLFIDEKR